MATIEPKRETIIKESFVLTYERSELEAIVENPKPWLREIKAVLDRSNQQPLKRAIAPAVKPTNKVQKKKPQKVAAKVEPESAGKYKCGHCPRRFKTEGWRNQHEAKEHGTDLGDIEIGSYQIERDNASV